ncbi:MAG: transposase [Acidobacteriota bacterium]
MCSASAKAGVPTDRSSSVGWNVLDYLPKDDRPQVKSLLRAAWKLDADKGIARIKKLAAWLDGKYPQAAASLLEGLEECFPINRLDIPPALWRCLATANIIESPHAGVRIQTRRVTHWQNGRMVLRWMASAFLRTEKRFKRIMGHKDLWALEAILNHCDRQHEGGVVIST